MTQDGAGLKDELKGMFDDRKMMVRMEQKEMERKVRTLTLVDKLSMTDCLQIQELNYKITVAMNSDTRGDIEGVRWLLTRRAALAIAIAVSMVLGTLNYSRFMHSAQEGAQKSHAKDMQDDVPPPSDHLQKNTKKVDSHGLGDELLSAPEALNNG